MRYLLDVNALIAFGHTGHQFHRRVATWAASLGQTGIPEFGTSSITELGFVRVLSQTSVYNIDVEQARALLTNLKRFKGLNFAFIADDHDVSHLPAWVKTSKQTTDGHLAQLAKANGAILATLDEDIPGSFIIPM